MSQLTDADRERYAGRDFMSLREEIATARLTLSAVIGDAKCDDLAAKADVINGLLMTIADLVEKAYNLESHRPPSSVVRD